MVMMLLLFATSLPVCSSFMALDFVLPTVNFRASPTRNAAAMVVSSSTRRNEDERQGNSGTPSATTTTTTRRTLLTNAAALWGMGTAVLGLPTESANAKFGASPNVLSKYIEYMDEQNSQGSTAGVVLYRGEDPAVLLKRLDEADRGFQSIPTLASDNEWSQIETLLVGPLQTMSEQLDQIASTSNLSDRKKQKRLQEASKRLKKDLIAIGKASDMLNAKACSAKAVEASKDLVRFLKIAFEQ